MQKLNWKQGNPTELGMYFVAVELGRAAGVFDFVEWNGDAWEDCMQGDVVAFIDVGSFISQLSIDWPFVDKINYQSDRIFDGEDPWIEV